MTEMQAERTRRVLRRREVEQRTGLGRSTIYRKIRMGEFPSPIRLGPQTVAWREEDIEQWLSSRPEARGGAA